MLGTYCTALYCTILHCTVQYCRGEAGNHGIFSTNYLAVIGVISVPSKIPFPIPTPFKKKTLFVEASTVLWSLPSRKDFLWENLLLRDIDRVRYIMQGVVEMHQIKLWT